MFKSLKMKFNFRPVFLSNTLRAETSKFSKPKQNLGNMIKLGPSLTSHYLATRPAPTAPPARGKSRNICFSLSPLRSPDHGGKQTSSCLPEAAPSLLSASPLPRWATARRLSASLQREHPARPNRAHQPGPRKFYILNFCVVCYLFL